VNNVTSGEQAPDIPEEMSLGCLLRKSREERRIDLDAVVKATRIRRHNLEALENEEWDKLPSQVFVKGFLRSYAEFLGLDKELVLSYYQKSSSFKQYQPHVLQGISAESGRWRLIIIVSLLAIALVAGVVYLRGRMVSVTEKVFQYLDTRTVTEKRETDTVTTRDIQIQDGRAAEGTLAEKETAHKDEMRIPTELEDSEDAPALEEPIIPEDVKLEPTPSPKFVLTATVHSRTWIAISIDDGPSGEYLFMPGETMKWTAENNFDLLIGNAGGIEFLLNGNSLGHLGLEGDVVRLRLPEG
jgi:cytoskeleton protein RodZ